MTTALQNYYRPIIKAWTLLAEDNRRVQAFHMTCQRRILGIPWYDFFTNGDVQRCIKLSDVLEIIARRRHSLFGHVRRLDPSSPAHAAFGLGVDSRSGIRPRSGYQARKWLEQTAGRLVARGSNSWRRTRVNLPRSCGGPRRTGGCGWLDDHATVHENDHQHKRIIYRHKTTRLKQAT